MLGRHSTEGTLWDQPVLSLQSSLGAVLSNHHQTVIAVRSTMFRKKPRISILFLPLCQILGPDSSEALITFLPASLSAVFTLLQFQFHILSSVGQNFLNIMISKERVRRRQSGCSQRCRVVVCQATGSSCQTQNSDYM